MSETTQETKAKVEEANSKQPEFVLTKTGVMIIGHELIGDKLLALLCESLKMNESCGVSTIVLRNDNYPREGNKPVFGMTYADTMSIAINLQHCWDRALKVAEKGDKNLSLLGILWVNLLSTIGHEIDHVDMAFGDRELFETMCSTEEGNKELEEVAAETAERLILKLALKFCMK